MGITFVVSAFLQTLRGFSAIKTGVMFTAATAGILVSSLAGGRLAKRHEGRTLIRTGLIVTIAGVSLLLPADPTRAPAPATAGTYEPVP